MRIGIDATALYGRYGGVEYSLWNLLFVLNTVNEEQHEPLEYSVFIPQDGPPPELLAAFSPRWRWVRLPFSGEHKARRIAWQQLALPFCLRAERCDVLHAPTYVLPLLNSLLPRRTPATLTVYDTIALDRPQFATRLNRLHYRIMLPRSITRADRIVVPSNAVRDSVTQRFPQVRRKLRVVPLGIEPIFCEVPSTQAQEEVRARYNLPGEFLLFVGNFEPKKNLPGVLEALKLLTDAPPLVVAGGGRAWHNVVSTPLVKPIGYVPRRDLPVLYSLCRAFVFPSLAEGFGLPVLEALAGGAPVVTSNAVPLPRLQEFAAICNPEEPGSIAHHIGVALGEEQQSTPAREARRDYAREFSWRRAAQATLQIYREAAG